MRKRDRRPERGKEILSKCSRVNLNIKSTFRYVVSPPILARCRSYGKELTYSARHIFLFTSAQQYGAIIKMAPWYRLRRVRDPFMLARLEKKKAKADRNQLLCRAYLTLFTVAMEQHVVTTMTPYITSSFSSHSLIPITSQMAFVILGIVSLAVSRLIDLWGLAQGFGLMIVATILGTYEGHPPGLW